jgi:hypothetical protein
MPSPRRGRAIAAVSCLTLSLALSGCKGGDDKGGGPPGAGGVPPGGGGQGAPGAPVVPGEQQGQGGAPGAPYKIPPTVLLDHTIDLTDPDVWNRIQSDIWAACPGGTHCVEVVRVYRRIAGIGPCLFYRVEPAVGSYVPYHRVISIVGGAPCGSGQGGEPPDSVAPDDPDSPPPPPPDSPAPDVS